MQQRLNQSTDHYNNLLRDLQESRESGIVEEYYDLLEIMQQAWLLADFSFILYKYMYLLIYIYIYMPLGSFAAANFSIFWLMLRILGTTSWSTDL